MKKIDDFNVGLLGIPDIDINICHNDVISKFTTIY